MIATFEKMAVAVAVEGTKLAVEGTKQAEEGTKQAEIAKNRQLELESIRQRDSLPSPVLRLLPKPGSTN